MKSNTTPSRQLIFSLDRKYQRNRLARTENITRLEKTVVSTRNVHMVKVAPKMSVVSTKQVSARASGKRVTIPYIHISMIRGGKDG